METSRPALTRNQSLVLASLERADGPLSAYALLDRLRDDGFRAPLQVYRALDALMKTGLVHRLESLNSFVACHGHHDHEHDAMTGFAICESCGQVVEFADRVVADRFSAWSSDNGFRPKRTVVELRGTCGPCAAKESF